MDFTKIFTYIAQLYGVQIDFNDLLSYKHGFNLVLHNADREQCKKIISQVNLVLPLKKNIDICDRDNPDNDIVCKIYDSPAELEGNLYSMASLLLNEIYPVVDQLKQPILYRNEPVKWQSNFKGVYLNRYKIEELQAQDPARVNTYLNEWNLLYSYCSIYFNELNVEFYYKLVEFYHLICVDKLLTYLNIPLRMQCSNRINVLHSKPLKQYEAVNYLARLKEISTPLINFTDFFHIITAENNRVKFELSNAGSLIINLLKLIGMYLTRLVGLRPCHVYPSSIVFLNSAGADFLPIKKIFPSVEILERSQVMKTEISALNLMSLPGQFPEILVDSTPSLYRLTQSFFVKNPALKKKAIAAQPLLSPHFL